jgi:cytochrome P450
VYWLFTQVWLRPKLVETIRQEALPLVELSQSGGCRLATLDAWQLEQRCPLLMSSYREVMRLGNQGIGTRRIVRDTVLTDSQGESHLLKAGVDIMWSVKDLHLSTEVWGPDAEDFDPRRFLEQDKFDRAKEQFFLPFGSGKHLYPGSNFAMIEMLGWLHRWRALRFTALRRRTSRCDPLPWGRPSQGRRWTERVVSVVVKRRAGWEGVEWKFSS